MPPQRTTGPKRPIQPFASDHAPPHALAHLTTRTIPRALCCCCCCVSRAFPSPLFPFSLFPLVRAEKVGRRRARRALSRSLAPNASMLIHAPLTAHAPTRAPFAASLFPLSEARAPKETRFGPSPLHCLLVVPFPARLPPLSTPS
jgi:hypothetical protein